MDSLFKTLADDVALGCELTAIVFLAVGAVEAIIGLLLGLSRWTDPELKRTTWRRFAAWIMLALELTLAADIVRTAIAPTWNDIGQLAAIALIRTFLNLFLERDLETLAHTRAPTATAEARENPPIRGA